MKRQVMILLATVLVLSTLLALGCGTALAEACPNCGADAWQVKEPTCGEAGMKLCTACGEVYPIPATGDHSWIDGKPAISCLEPGNKLCTKCGLVEDVPGPHSWMDGKAPTCVEPGNRLCTLCGEVETVAIDPTAHKPVATDAVAATCTAAGQEADGVKCELCGTVLTAPTEIPALGHTWERNGFDITSKKNQNKKHGWVVDQKATTSKTGVGHYNCLDCSAASDSVTIPKLKKTSPSSSSESVQPTASVALAYGSIVTDAARAEAEYASANDAAASNVLIITAEPDEGGVYALRNLHITDALLAQLASEKIDTVRFVVGKGTVEFPVSSFTSDAMASAKASLTSPATQYIVTVDPTAVTADGAPGCSVSVSVACEDGSEYDVTSLVADLTLTQNKVTRLVSVAAVYIS